MKKILALALAISIASPSLAKAHAHKPPSQVSLQNKIADRENLSRFRTENELEEFKKKKLLVPLSGIEQITFGKQFPLAYRWCRPEAKTFLLNLAADYYANFHEHLPINSAVRTAGYQQTLRNNGNKNAAGATPGPHQSLHLTGAAIDIGKKPMSSKERVWTKGRLDSYYRAGRIRYKEEFRQAVFHVLVLNGSKSPKSRS